MSEDDFLKTFDAAKRASVGQLLMKCGRLFNEQALAKVREETGEDTLRTSHTALFPHIDFEGTRQTVLAAKLGISKQAVGQLVAELEGIGMLERIPDPSDGRAKLIRFSNRGRFGLMQGMKVLAAVEAELEEELGSETMAALHDGLTALHEILERREREGS